MMTRKERFERALRREEVDRLPFWAKIFGRTYLDFQEKPYREMGEPELADHLDLDHMGGGGAPVVGHNDRVEWEVERQNGRRVERIKTPDGTLTAVERTDPSSPSWHPVEFPIKRRDDLRAARHIFEGSRFETSDELVANNHRRLQEVGDRGIVMTGMGISPLMSLIQHLIGPDNTYYFLADYPDEMEELIGLMHEERLRFLRCLLSACPFEYIVSVENTSTTLLSPEVFERYCRRHLEDYGRLIKEHGKSHVLHQCGHLRDLLPRIDDLPSDAIEAYTTPPVGNTTIADRVNLAPNTAVIGGTNAALWMRPAEEICAAIEQSLAEAGTIEGLVLTCAGEMPPAASIEKIKQVREFVKGITP